MTKKNFVSLILGTVGGILFSLGMCMALVEQWGMLNEGIVVGTAGALLLLVMALIRRKMSGKPMFGRPSVRNIGTVLLGLVGTLTLGVGMCMVMVWEMMLQGILVGIVGIVLLLCLIPACLGLK